LRFSAGRSVWLQEAVATAILAWPVYVIRPTKKELALKPHLRVGLGDVRHLLLLQIAEGNARVPQERVGSSTSKVAQGKNQILGLIENAFTLFICNGNAH